MGIVEKVKDKIKDEGKLNFGFHAKIEKNKKVKFDPKEGVFKPIKEDK